MDTYTDEISWKGIGDYLSAAKTINEYGTSNTSGPCNQCQGIALELALKYYLYGRLGSYPGTHNLEFLAFDKCRDIDFSAKEIENIKNLNKQYLNHDGNPFPSRYRPACTTVFNAPSLGILEETISRIIKNTSRPELENRVLTR